MKLNEQNTNIVVSKIGPYFIYKDTIIADMKPRTEINPIFNSCDYEYPHDKFFEEIKGNYLTDSYIEVPRGRVTYNVQKKKSILFIDECYINNQAMINEVVKLYKLDEYEVKGDIHYHCSKCLADDIFNVVSPMI